MSVIGNTAMRFDEEQSMLLDYARSFCADRGGLNAAREHLESPLEYSPQVWEEMVAMGWTGIGLPEEIGGSGLGIGAAVPVAESLGKALMGTPLISTLLTAQLLLRADASAAADVLAGIAAGDAACVAELESEDWNGPSGCFVDDAGLLQGRKQMVMDAQSARWIAVLITFEDASAIAVVDARDLGAQAISPRVLIDNTHRAADVGFVNVQPVLLVSGESVSSALRDYRLLGALLVAAESTGATAACLDVTVEYLKTRKQFGKLIGSYQALKHPSVEILTMMDSARSFIYHASSLITDEALAKDQEIACRMAKAQATEALKFAGDRAVQFHGGMGFTWDCDAQLFIRRAQWAQQQFGDAQHHRQRLAALLIDD
ncbi:acyl-CoA dehydrogenase family protein [Congregibacter variabilis]|uniref:Acyl-CoA dehydrogenase family protein n=1 Tax=Congregibacter variabilis TaxID=3081200 RepID=A0ABZ0I5B6_9GAMM|nr:acyl-CoA dehydrogenase family protein [Congregibacter sp. IMCC43200]